MKKLTTFLLTVVIVLSTVTGLLAGCGGREEENFDTAKSHLYVGVYAAGYGTQFAKDVATRFEEFYKDKEFEPGSGKVGVQVHIMDIFEGNTFMGQVENSPIEVFFTDNCDYYMYNEKGYVLDITDALSTPLTEYGENKSIFDKMEQTQKDMYNIDNKYYAISYVDGQYGITFNVDLWEKKELYFAKGGCPSEYLRTNSNCDDALAFPGGVTEWKDDLWAFTGTGDKSAGPDGKYNTVDDGQPATYEEFYKLCDNCYEKDIQALSWPGKSPTQLSKMMMQMVFDYLGKEQSLLHYSFDGIAKDLIDIDASGNIIPLGDVTIKNDNGYLLSKHRGIYEVLNFWKGILDRTNFYDSQNNVFNLQYTHTDAQDDFVSGGIVPGKNEIAMLVDGDWWINEAKPIFDDIEKAYGSQYSVNNRRFQMLSYPKATNEKVGEPFTIQANSTSMAAINGNIATEKIDLAKAFLRFAFTNESNLEFTKTTGIKRQYDYVYPDGYINGLNYFTKKTIELNETADKFFHSSSNKMLRANYFVMYNSEIFWGAEMNGNSYSVPNDAMVKGIRCSAKDYFRGMQVYHDSDWWNYSYGAFFNK